MNGEGGHIHRFRALTFDGWLPITKWRCACGLSTRSTKIVRKLNGTSL